MSYFDDASLVFIPSGTKVSKAYSVKPIDGSGDLAFTRSNDTATRVASNGLIEKVRTNLVFQSETFGAATWGKSLVTITTDFDTAPNGTLTADRFVSAGGSFPQISQTRTVVSGTQYTASLYVKSDGTTQIAQAILIGGGGVGFTPTTSWQRISVTFTAASSSASFVIATNSPTAPASSFVIWGAQLEVGDIATDYITTPADAAVSVGPVANVPRLDYLNSTCPKLLLEPQRSNLALFSEQFDNAGWNKAAASVTANNSVSPDGYANADLITSSGAAGYVYPSNTNVFAAAAGATYSYSVYLKAGTASIISLLVSATATYTGVFNLSTGVATTSTANTTASMSSVGNGWYRCIIVCSSVANSAYSELQIGRVASGLTFSAYGAQLEAGAYATSYIPTLGASVTRGADECSKTGISSLIGQTEGTLFVEFAIKIVSEARRILCISDGSISNRVVLAIESSNQFRALITNGGVQQFSSLVSATDGRNKLAVSYKANDFSFYLNGVQVSTQLSGSVPLCSDVYLGKIETSSSSLFLADGINQSLLFKTRLTNAQLAELTAL